MHQLPLISVIQRMVEVRLLYYTVPNGYEFYLYRIDAFSNDSTASKPGLFRNYVQYPTGAEYVVARTTFSGNMNIQRQNIFSHFTRHQSVCAALRAVV